MSYMKILYLFLLFLSIISPVSRSQLLIRTENQFFIGAQAGFSFTFGSHQNRLGLIIKGFVGYDFVQLNPQMAFYKNFRSIGANQPAWETQIRLGAVVSWGRRDSIRQVFVNEISNQTLKNYSLAYAYIWYKDTQGTRQKAGALAFQARKFQFAMENDFLCFIAQDRYRTGAVALAYQVLPHTRLILKHVSYTGDPYGQGTNWRRDTDFPARFGYMDMNNVLLGDRSIGSLTVGAEQALPFYQQANFDVGIDAEQVRNAMQNKFIHDNPLIPANWGDNPEGKNPHIPMLDRKNKSYLYQKEQKIRRPRFFGLLNLNGTWFY